MKNFPAQEKSDKAWLWLKHSLGLRGLTFGIIARDHGKDKACFTRAKKHPLPKAERILANYIGLDPWDIWPERYDAAHNPNRISSRYQGHKHFLCPAIKMAKVESKKEIAP
jgi:lambda repressor-like predicted transcriptional regulator